MGSYQLDKYISNRTAGLILVLMVCIVYIPAMKAGFVWDDTEAIVNNPLIRSDTGIRDIWINPSSNPAETHYWPLAYTIFWAEYRLWNISPIGYHAVNIILYCFNVIFIWLILRKLKVPGAWFASAIFAVHPIHVESVAWMVELKDVLSGLLYLITIYTYLHSLDLTKHKKKIFYLLSLFCFLFALLTKSIVVSLPLVLLLILWWKEKRLTRKVLIPIVPYFILSFCIAGLDFLIYSQHRDVTFSYNFLERCAIAGHNIWFYVGKLLWPYSLLTIYPRWEIPPNIVIQLFYPLTVGTVLIVLFLFRKKIGKGAFVATSYFVITLGPILGFLDFGFMTYSFVADRFQYLASIGLIGLFAAILTQIIQRYPHIPKSIKATISSLLLVTLGILTWIQCTYYKDLGTLFQHTLSKNPHAWIAHYNLGRQLSFEHKVREAISHYALANQMNPDSSIMHNVYGNALAEAGRYDDALTQYYTALKIKPAYAQVLNNIGALFQIQGDALKANSFYTQSLEIKPNQAEPYYNRGLIFYQEDKLNDAYDCFIKALAIKPDFAEAHNAVGICLAQMGKLGEAIAHFSRALHIQREYSTASTNLDKSMTAFQNKMKSLDLPLNVHPLFID